MSEKLNAIFGNPEFVAANKDKDNFEDIFAAVKACDGTVTQEELQLYLEEVSVQMQKTVGSELSETELTNVAGGGIGAAGVIGLLAGCYKLGEGLGKFIYNVSHR